MKRKKNMLITKKENDLFAELTNKFLQAGEEIIYMLKFLIEKYNIPMNYNIPTNKDKYNKFLEKYNLESVNHIYNNYDKKYKILTEGFYNLIKNDIEEYFKSNSFEDIELELEKNNWAQLLPDNGKCFKLSNDEDPYNRNLDKTPYKVNEPHKNYYFTTEAACSQKEADYNAEKAINDQSFSYELYFSTGTLRNIYNPGVSLIYGIELKTNDIGKIVDIVEITKLDPEKEKTINEILKSKANI